ncbi:DUF4254 domain-containing protein [Nocardia panacis]|uniref:DUF4254 domain-containing protein n=1 Tax=Nocardia panacis TaxID=2340916 RepID=A0A3A4KPV3_9NOCA|nr:DUF4254 domain-containing protein [Nocardia panacis]RJO77585.1 DUF4254 domain-containing protein [Nocardia panacis]
MPIEYAEASIGTHELPTATALLRAFRDPLTARREGHRVLSAARDLVECHRRRSNALGAVHAPDTSSGRVAACRRQVDDIDGDRAELVGSIDNWVAGNVAHRAGASLHTETLGAVIDRMAAKWVAAQEALHLETQGAVHQQWCRLAELADGYQDLITDVTERRRRLPVW